MHAPLRLIAFSIALAVPTLARPQQTVGDVCRNYARAVEAVATARDNLDDPSWDKLVELHPVLKKDGKNDRAVLYAQLINLRIINKTATPQALKVNAYESCPQTYSCMFLNEGCPQK